MSVSARFRSQLWNLGSRTRFQESTLELGSGHLGAGTCFQESTLGSCGQDFVSWFRKSTLEPCLFSGVNPGILGPAPAFRNRHLGFGRLFEEDSGILGSGTCFQESSPKLGHPLSGVNSAIFGAWFRESTLESWDRDFVSGAGTGLKS